MYRLLEPPTPPATRRFVTGLVAMCTVLVLSSCEDALSPHESDLQSSSPSRASGQLFSVLPSGGDDTENIRAAIAQAQAAGPGSTVYLEPGEFHTSILIFQDFVGKFKGAGIDRTTVKPMSNLDFGSGPFYVDYPTYENPWPALISVVGGDMTVSDMTFLIEDPSPALPYDYYSFHTDALGNVLTVTGDEANSRVERVRFEGSEGNFLGGNVATGFYLQGPMAADDPFTASGRHSVSDCSFQDVLLPIGTAVGNARVTIGGSPGRGNTIQGAWMGIVINDAVNSHFDISHNKVEASWYGIRVWQGYFHEIHTQDLPGFPLGHGLQARIAHNTITANGAADGVMLRDVGLLETGRPGLRAVVNENEISLDTQLGGIHGWGTDGLLVKKNRIRGSGLAGIYLGFDAPDSRWRILHNEVNEMEAVQAPIVLGPESRDVIVVGASAADVLDLGTGNKVVGVNHLKKSSSTSDIREEMRRKHALMRSMRW